MTPPTALATTLDDMAAMAMASCLAGEKRTSGLASNGGVVGAGVLPSYPTMAKGKLVRSATHSAQTNKRLDRMKPFICKTIKFPMV